MSHWRIRLNGLGLIAAGALFTLWSWYTALQRGHFYPVLTAVVPGIAVVGMGMLFFPQDEPEVRSEGGDAPGAASGSGDRSQFNYGVALAAALLNWYLIAQF